MPRLDPSYTIEAEGVGVSPLMPDSYAYRLQTPNGRLVIVTRATLAPEELAKRVRTTLAARSTGNE